MDSMARYLFAAVLLLVATFCFYRAIVVWDSGKTGAGLHQAFMSAVCVGAVAAAYYMLNPPA